MLQSNQECKSLCNHSLLLNKEADIAAQLPSTDGRQWVITANMLEQPIHSLILNSVTAPMHFGGVIIVLIQLVLIPTHGIEQRIEYQQLNFSEPLNHGTLSKELLEIAITWLQQQLQQNFKQDSLMLSLQKNTQQLVKSLLLRPTFVVSRRQSTLMITYFSTDLQPHQALSCSQKQHQMVPYGVLLLRKPGLKHQEATIKLLEDGHQKL